MELQTGNTYHVNHSRKGEFTLKVTDIDDTWISGEIVDGETNTMMASNKRFTGDLIQIRKSFCTFTNL